MEKKAKKIDTEKKMKTDMKKGKKKKLREPIMGKK